MISAEEVRHAIEGPVSTAVDIVKATLGTCPPELAGDIMDRGIALTGGGALLRGLDERLRVETGMLIQLAHSPLESVVLGAGKCVENFDSPAGAGTGEAPVAVERGGAAHQGAFPSGSRASW